MGTQRFTTYAGQTPGRMPGTAERPDAMMDDQPVTTLRGTAGVHTRFRTYTRTGTPTVEAPFEKPVVLAGLDNYAARDLVWAEALFATDILAEHALFFTLLMPEELAHEERLEALQFQTIFTELHEAITVKGPPAESDLRQYVAALRAQIQPFIDFKRDNHRAQVRGELHSLVWPLFFDHTRREAERWLGRLEDIASGYALERREVVSFGCEIMDEHARFIAHLLDPEEFELMEKSTRASTAFRALNPPAAGRLATFLQNSGVVDRPTINDQDMDFVMTAAQTILDFKTEAARGIEAARIRSIIDPRLADHVRREAVKFIDELRRTRAA